MFGKNAHRYDCIISNCKPKMNITMSSTAVSCHSLLEHTASYKTTKKN